MLDQVSINSVSPTRPSYVPGFVNLFSAFNRTGIVADGTTFSGGGLDGDGNAFSSSLLGTSLTAGGTTFNLGPAGASDVVSAAGQTIALPSGNDTALKLLATAVNGSQPNQTFTVTYTDGTTASFTQSISDWAIPQGYAGESTALTTSYRDTASGTEQTGHFNVYEYTLALNPNKSVFSITLPNNANVEVLAATLVPAGTTQVSLSSAFNRTGIAVDGTTFGGGGLDGGGNAFSSSLLGTSLTAGGATFNLGPAGASDVVSAAGQTIALPTGNDSALKLLATGVNGDQVNQTFTVTYTDGTTATFTQSISDWAVPQGYAGESTALTTSYRDKSSGTEQVRAFNVYEYTFVLNSTKAVRSITLPNDANVEVLAATLIPAGTTQVNLSSAFNRTGIVADGTTFSGGGLDGGGYAFSSSLVGTSLTAGGTIFNLGPAGASDVVSATGQTIALPSGNDSALKLLATGVNGNQVNQTFTVTYTDGTTATFTQSISDWATPQGYAGESTALTTSYRDTSSGTEQTRQFNVYEYTFALNPTKTVSSITLPNDANVEVLAATLIPAATTQVEPLLHLQPDGDRGGRDEIQRGRARRRRLCLLLEPARDEPDRRRRHLQPRPRRGQRRRQRRRADHRSALGQRRRAQAAGDRRQQRRHRRPGEPDLHRDLHRRDHRDVHPVDQRLGDTAGVRRGVDGADDQLSRHVQRDGAAEVWDGGTEGFNVYEYTFVLDPTKTVQSITLPNDANVEVLAIDVLP